MSFTSYTSRTSGLGKSGPSRSHCQTLKRNLGPLSRHQRDRCSAPAGWPTPTTHGPRAAGGAPAILEPERPRRRRSNRNPVTAASSPTGPACAPPTPRGLVAARPGRLPAHHITDQRPVVLRRPTGFPALRASRRASGVTAAERQRQRPARAQAAARAARCGPP